MNYIVLRSRSRFAPSLWSGSTTKISHREIFSAQDDTNRRINEKIGRFSCENQFYYIRVVVGADPYTPLSAMWRGSIIGFPLRGSWRGTRLMRCSHHRWRYYFVSFISKTRMLRIALRVRLRYAPLRMTRKRIVLRKLLQTGDS